MDSEQDAAADGKLRSIRLVLSLNLLPKNALGCVVVRGAFCYASLPLTDGLSGNLEFLFQFAWRRPRTKSLAHLGLDFVRVVPREPNSPDIVFKPTNLPETFPRPRFVSTDAKVPRHRFVAPAVLEDLQGAFFKTDFGWIVVLDFHCAAIGGLCSGFFRRRGRVRPRRVRICVIA